MNQIICTKNSNLIIDKNSNEKNSGKKLFFKAEFLSLTIITASLLIYYIHFRYSLYEYERVSKNLSKGFGITKIYNKSNDYKAKHLSYEPIYYKDTSFIIIGNIKIEKLDISYPILSEISKEALKIAPCRFAGPMPNETR